ncbi:ParB/RepB/Spo0J family partition protein [Nitratireductor arenosus]|nr:ParB/RepB/Spo0J family partition protein [Nitratireductor arenosus]
MKLTHLKLKELFPSKLNVRKKGGGDLCDLLPSIRSLGVLQPLLVRPDGEAYEIIAGGRRYRALRKLAEEGIAEPVPCAVMEEGDDARAIEASLAENIARLPMDEIDQYKAFAALVKKGMDAADVAAKFGVTERLVKQRLAIANLIGPILTAYRKQDIDPGTVRVLTLATKAQQKAWWELFTDEEQYLPYGQALKDWLFGGQHIPVSAALFAEGEYPGAIIADLFGEERYFADAASFWPLQNKAIAERRDAYLAAGWKEVVILEPGERFATWEHAKVARTKGGKVFIAIARNGAVTFHEGYVSAKEARRLEKAQAGKGGDGGDAADTKPARPECTKAMVNYIDLHKHAAVRTGLLAHPKVALRLVVAHIIAGSSLWSVNPEPQRAHSEDIRDSLAGSPAQQQFAKEREAIRTLLAIEEPGEDEDQRIVPPGLFKHQRELADILAMLLLMDDDTVLRILTFVMAETLEAGTGLIEGLGQLLKTDMAEWWRPDETFFDLLRDKPAINAMLREVAGEATADAHLSSTAKLQKKIIAKCLSGEDRTKVEHWQPRYMGFPGTGYTGRFEGYAVVGPFEAGIDDDAEVTDADEANAEDAA